MENIISKANWRYRLIKWFYSTGKPTDSCYWMPDTTCSLNYFVTLALLLSPIRIAALTLEAIMCGKREEEPFYRDMWKWNGFMLSLIGVLVSIGSSIIIIMLFEIMFLDSISDYHLDLLIICPVSIVVVLIIRGVIEFIWHLEDKFCKPIKFE